MRRFDSKYLTQASTVTSRGPTHASSRLQISSSKRRKLSSIDRSNCWNFPTSKNHKVYRTNEAIRVDCTQWKIYRIFATVRRSVNVIFGWLWGEVASSHRL